MENFLGWLGARLKERSTWLGITGLVTTLGVALSPELMETIVGIGTGIGALIAIMTRDKAPPAP